MRRTRFGNHHVVFAAESKFSRRVNSGLVRKRHPRLQNRAIPAHQIRPFVPVQSDAMPQAMAKKFVSWAEASIDHHLPRGIVHRAAFAPGHRSGKRRILRPANLQHGLPGYGVYEGTIANGPDKGLPYAVLNLMGRVFMNGTNDPFRAADEILAGVRAKIIFVDFHAEATSEKVAMGWHLDGRVTAVLGTHTHIPTADERVLPGGTAYQTDVGMSGPYDSVIGVEKDLVLARFRTGMPGKFEAATGNPKMCAALIKCDGATGRAHHIQRIMLGE